ncbi:MAG: YibE/F family protein [Eubacteriales bacterium]|nr:YibE/F family protein [Eubacteriales bacterium]
MRILKKRWTYFAVIAALSFLIVMLPDAVENDIHVIPRVQVEVLEVDNSLLDPVGIVYNGAQECVVQINEGKYKGEKIQAQNYLNASLDKDKLYKPGEKAICMLHERANDLVGTMVDHDRRGVMFILLALLFVMLAIFGGLSGVGASLSLVFTAIVIWKVYIPLMIQGYPPVATAIGLIAVLGSVICVLVSGPNLRALTAILGGFAGTAVTVILGVIFTKLFKLDGGMLPYIVPLLSQSGMTFNMNELFLCTIFIGNAGAVIDLAMDISAGCTEIISHAPNVTAKDLMKSGFNIGKMDIGTMSNTLVMGYAGGFLSMLLYFSAQGTPLVDILNYRFVAAEIMVTLVGCFGLISAAPLTSFIASRIMTANPQKMLEIED